MGAPSFKTRCIRQRKPEFALVDRTLSACFQVGMQGLAVWSGGWSRQTLVKQRQIIGGVEEKLSRIGRSGVDGVGHSGHVLRARHAVHELHFAAVAFRDRGDLVVT